MAKSKSRDVVGKMDEQLKDKTSIPEKKPLPFHGETPKPTTLPFKGETPEPKPLDEMISKPEAELLVKKFLEKNKEDLLPLRETIQEVKDRNRELQKLKAERTQQPMYIICDLRQYDPKGKKTCGRCAQRVPIETMDTKKELCEVCAS